MAGRESFRDPSYEVSQSHVTGNPLQGAWRGVIYQRAEGQDRAALVVPSLPDVSKSAATRGREKLHLGQPAVHGRRPWCFQNTQGHERCIAETIQALSKDPRCLRWQSWV